MKNSHFVYPLLIMLPACSGRKSGTANLSEEIKGLDNDTIYIYGVDEMYGHTGTLLIESNKSSKTVSLDTLIAVRLLFSDGTQYPFFMGEGNKVQIKGSAVELGSLEIGGDIPSGEFSAFRKELKGLRAPSEKVLKDGVGKFINEHYSSLVSIYLLGKCFVQEEKPDYAQIRKLTERMIGEPKDRPYANELLSHIQEEEKAAIGKTTPYFRIPNPKDKQINRSNSKDQYLLIHFRAPQDTVSWDSSVVYRRVYRQERKNKKFTLLRVSLDMSKDTWQKAIKVDTLEQEQACDFSGWSVGIVKQFAIKTLPTDILLSPSGKIEGKGIAEETIKKGLKEIEDTEKEEQQDRSKR